MRHLHALLLLLTMFLSGPALAQSALSGGGEPITLGRSFEIASRHYEKPRRINVLLPQQYDDPDAADRRYPVLYLLDGGTGWQDFAHIAAMVQQGGLWGANAPMIVVGIESGDRRAELTSPSSNPAERKDFPTHGRSDLFRRFLVEELRPAVEARWRTDGNTGLIGESLAGLFVVETALRHPGAFDRHIAISPSLWWDGGRLSHDAEALLSTRPDQPGALWLSIADEGGSMQAAMDRLVAALKSRAPAAFQWQYHPYPDENHGTIYHPAATRAVRALFPAPPAG